MKICNLYNKEFKIAVTQGNSMSYKIQKDNSVKSIKQYTKKIRILTKRENIKENQTEILELKNIMNEIKNNITLTSEWKQVKEKKSSQRASEKKEIKET